MKIAVMGGGPGGYVAAIKAAKLEVLKLLLLKMNFLGVYV